MRRTSVFLFVAAVALGTSSVVYADMLIFSQNFDSFSTSGAAYANKTTGQGDSTTTAGLWRAAGRSSSSTSQSLAAKTDTTVSRSASQSVKITRPASGGRGQLEGFTTITGSPFATGQIQVEAWLREEVDAFGFMSSSSLEISNQVGTTTVTSPPFKIFTGRTSSGFNSLSVLDSVAAAWVDTGKAIPTDQSWFGVRLIADLDTGHSSAYINYGLGGGWEVGALGVAGLTGSIGAGANCIILDSQAAFDSSGASSQSGTTWIDDVVLQISNPLVPGDYNGNDVVDAADYVVWRKNNGLMGGATVAQGDGTGDGNVMDDDYTYWRDRFGNPTPGSGSGGLGSSSVPEPAAALLLAVGVGVCCAVFGVSRCRNVV